MIKRILVSLLLMVSCTLLIFGSLPQANAVPTSSNVLIVLNPSLLDGVGTDWPARASTWGGTLPTGDPAFNAFTFTALAGGFPSLSAAAIAGFDTIVLVVSSATDISTLTAAQKTLLNDFVFTGGKLIIYDSECTPSVDYSWLAYPFTTRNPSAQGYGRGAFAFVEDNTLGSTNALRPDHPTYYIDNTTIPAFAWGDYVGDCNTFVTYDAHWCGDIKAYNYYSDPQSGGYDGSAPDWTHTYAVYGNGLFIYNGFDINPMGQNDVPSHLAGGNMAKIWLMELLQPWGADYNLPCTTPPVPEPPVGGVWAPGTVLELLAPWILIALIVLAAAAAGTRHLLMKRW